MANTPRSITYPVGSDSGDIANHFYNLATTTDAAITNASTGMKNVIINGGFDIWQRGDAAFTNNGYTADRWLLAQGNGSTNSITRWSGWGNPAFDGTRIFNCATWSRTVAGTSESYLGQRIEDVRTLDGGDIKVSFWAWTQTGSVDITIKTQQYFGLTGDGASSAVYPGSTTITATTTITRHSATVSLPSTYGKTIVGKNYLMLYLSRAHNATNGATGTVYITGVQIERGAVMTPFETRPQQTEMALCQRYYLRLVEPKLVGVVDGSQKPNRMGMNWPVQMRDTPEVTIIGSMYLWDGNTPGFANAGSIGVTYHTKNCLEWNLTVSGWAIGRAIVSYVNGGWAIEADAEL